MLNSEPVRGLTIEQQTKGHSMRKNHGICHAQAARKHRRKGHALNVCGSDKHGHTLYFWALPQYAKPEYVKRRPMAEGSRVTWAAGPRKGLAGRMMD